MKRDAEFTLVVVMYPWGKASFPAEKMPPILLGVGVVAGLILFAANGFVAEGGPAANPNTGALDVRKLKGVMLVTLGVAFLIETGLGAQVWVNTFKDFKPKPEESNAAYRGLYNSLEHAGPALIFIWVHAVLVNSNTATLLGATYTTARFAYGFLFGTFGGFTIAVEPCTEFCYTLLSLLLVGTLASLAGAGDVLASASAHIYKAVPLGLGAIIFWWAGVWMPLGLPVAKTILAGVAWKEAASEK